MPSRRTKIVATLGPSSSSPQVLEQLILAGMNVARLNCSHGSPDEHKARAQLVRELAAKHDRHVALLGDLQGPKIRIAKFANKRIELQEGDAFRFSISHPRDAGTQEVVGIDYPDLVKDCKVGDELLLDDGRVIMVVDQVTATELICSVTVGGPLSDHKGINRRGGGLTAPALTDKDKADIKLAAEMDLDYLAVSFPRDAADIKYARRLLREAGGEAGLIAKIERAETVNDLQVLDAIIEASDGVMVARGDLGVEIGDAELVAVQKLIIERARTLNRVVITATQMMESMITQSMPTRAEVFDVANAVLYGTDAVMLSAETAAGAYPIETVEAMRRVIVGAEKHPQAHRSRHRMDDVFHKIDESIAMAAMYAANHLHGVKAIICMTESGDTPRLMSRIRSHLPIYAFSRNPRTQHRVALFRGVQTIPFDSDSFSVDEVNSRAVDELLRRGVVADGDHVLISRGDYANAQGGTNCLRVIRVGDRIY